MEKLEQSDYEEDYNRLDKEFDAKEIRSKEEWIQRLRQRGYKDINQKFLNMWYQERIQKYISDNKKIIKQKRKYKRWTQPQEDFILNNPDLPPRELYKKSIFTGRTKASISTKRRRLFRIKLLDIPKGYGKRSYTFKRFKRY